MSIQSSSEVFGEALLSLTDGRRAKVYHALRPVLCAECTNVIAVGELFTRRELQGVALSPQCRECAPFEFTTENESKGNELMKTLLSSSTENPDAVTHNKRAHEEIQKRIGPALERVNKNKRNSF